jgi:hypothetical protein
MPQYDHSPIPPDKMVAFLIQNSPSAKVDIVREPIMNPMIDKEISIISVGPQAQKDKGQVANSPHDVEVRKSTRMKKPNPKYFK